MKIKLLAAVLVWGCGFGNVSQAQKEANVWYFGNHSGLDFNSGSPVALANSAMWQWEGCSTISDANGNLLFYTNGIKVWDRNHNQMPNGDSLAGGLSSSQSALIVPFPGNIQLYYLFTVQEVAAAHNFSYSIVDMSLNNNNGDITVKNDLIKTPVTEKLTGVKHSNGNDVWVMVHGLGSDSLFAYLITSGGISTSPVVSKIGQAILFNNHAQGCMKFSPYGSKLAFAASQANYVDLFDFNSATGIVSNEIYLPTTPFGGTYGIEFSSNGDYLYSSEGGSYEIYQWDISSGLAATINASLFIDSAFYAPYGLQMGADKKIYLTHHNESFLGVINYPDSSGVSCNYVDNAISLSGLCYLDLPNFITSYFLPTGISANNTQQNELTISPNPATDKIYISFPATASETITTKIFSITGEVVYEKLFQSAYGGLEKLNAAIDITGLSNGIYFLSVQTGKEVVTGKIAVNH